MESKCLIWESSVAVESERLLQKVNNCHERKRVAIIVINCYLKSLFVAESHQLLWNSVVAMEVNGYNRGNWLLCKDNGCYGESLDDMESHSVLKKSMVAMESHLLICIPLVLRKVTGCYGSIWLIWKFILLWKDKCCFGIQWLLWKVIGCYGSLWLLWKVTGCHRSH
jgi:hypothetical protein